MFQKFHRVQNWLYACKSWCKCIFHVQCSASYHWNFTEITYVGTWNKFLERVYFYFRITQMVCKLAPSAHIRYVCENSMIAHSAFVMKDTFTPRFASIQWILDSVEFLKNSEVILAKFPSSCVYMLSFSWFVVVFRFCKVGQLVWCIKCH